MCLCNPARAEPLVTVDDFKLIGWSLTDLSMNPEPLNVMSHKTGAWGSVISCISLLRPLSHAHTHARTHARTKHKSLDDIIRQQCSACMQMSNASAISLSADTKTVDAIFRKSVNVTGAYRWVIFETHIRQIVDDALLVLGAHAPHWTSKWQNTTV